MRRRVGKGHRDNHKARKKALKRGKDAFALKKNRRAVVKLRCRQCGVAARASVVKDAYCPRCHPLTASEYVGR